MATTIITKNGSGAPAAGDLTAGELAVDLTNKRLYSKDSGGTVIELGTNPGSSGGTISGATIDDSVIGGTTPAAGTFTTFTSNGIDDNADAIAITIDSSENVGIGATTVDDLLHLEGANAGIKIEASDNDKPHIDLIRPASSTNYRIENDSAEFHIEYGATGTFGTDIARYLSDRWEFHTNGSERMRIDSSGNVGVGTASPNAALEVKQAASASKTFIINGTGGQSTADRNAIFAIDGTEYGYIGVVSGGGGSMAWGVSGSDRLTISTSGDVGIGTTSTSGIQGNLHIHSSSDDNSDGDGEVNFGDESTVIISTNATSAGAQGYYGSLFFGGQDVASETQQVWKLAGISAYSDLDIGTTGSADLLFYTTNAASTPSERMRITADAKVGIGHNDPVAKLAILGSSNDTIAEVNANLCVEGADGNGIIFGTQSSSPYRSYIQSGYVSNFSTATYDLLLNPQGGKVGIGASPGTSRLLSHGENNTSSGYTLYCRNSDNTINFYVRNDGIISTGTDGNSPYNHSVSGRDVYVSSAGVLGYLSSTRESKDNIQNLNDISWVYDLNTVSFNYRAKDEETNAYTTEVIPDTEYGLIADEVEQVNANLCFYDEDSEGNQTLAGVSYRKLVPVLVKAVQDQKATIDSQASAIADLTTRLEALEAN